MTVSLPILPHHVILQILSWLPATTLFSLRCVCRTWSVITSDPYFVDLHHQRATAVWKHRPSYLLASGFNRACLLDSGTAAGGAGDDGSDDADHGNKLTNIKVTELRRPQGVDSYVMSHCRGLTCYRLDCSRHSLSAIVVRNLTTGQQRVLKRLSSYGMFFKSELGFDPVAKEYKLLHLTHINRRLINHQDQIGSGSLPYAAKIYTLGSDSWRKLPDCPFPIFTYYPSSNYHGRALHWLTTTKTRGGGGGCVRVVSFDVGSETFRSRAGPKQLLGLPDDVAADVRALQVLTCFGDALSLVITDSKRHAMEIWKEENADGGDASWSKHCTISLEQEHYEYLFRGGYSCRFAGVVGPWTEDGELLIQTRTGLVAYTSPNNNQRSSRFRKLELPSLDKKPFWPASQFTHVENLVSLEDLFKSGPPLHLPSQSQTRVY